MVKVKAFGRIHSGLISLHESGYRRFGGVGFSLCDPHLEVICKKASRIIRVVDKRSKSLEKTELEKLSTAIGLVLRSKGIREGVSIEINGDLLPHTGLGSGTALYLASIEACLSIYQVDYDMSDIVKLSGRGGTSGIGVNLYFSGGAVLDLGHEGKSSSWTPSSNKNNIEQPLLLSAIDMPQWPIKLFTPTGHKGLSGKRELEFFSNNLPLSSDDTFYMCYHSIYGYFSSIVDRSLPVFVSSVKAIQKSKWKALEIDQCKESKVLIDMLNESFSGCAGLTSMGPTVYSVGDICWDSQKAPPCYVIETLPRNTGRELIYA